MSLAPLDDRSYEDLLAQARALIAAHAPEWTDHNPSDPGIAMLELFAWLAEMLIFRADQIPDRQTLAFVRLLRGPDWTPAPGGATASETSDALRELREQWRAVTPQDYERLTPAAAPGQIARVRVAPRRDLAAAAPDADAPGAVSVVVLPRLAPTAVRSVTADRPVDLTPGAAVVSAVDTALWIGAASPFGGVRITLAAPGAGYDLRFAYYRGGQWQAFAPTDGTAALTRSGTITFPPPTAWAPIAGEDPPRFWLRISTASAPSKVARARRVAAVMPQPSPALVATVRDFLEPRRVLTTRPVVVGATFAPVGVDVLVARHPAADEAALRAEIAARFEDILDPIAGGPDAGGWPLGRSVYVSELQQLIDALPGVDHVPDVLPTIAGAGGSVLTHSDGDPVGIDIGASRLPDARVDESRIVIGTSFVSVLVTLALQVPATTDVVALRATAKRAVREHFHPLFGGPAGGAAKHWPVADLEAKVRAATGLANVAAQLKTVPDRMTRDSAKLPVLSLRESEFVDASTDIALS